MKFSPFLVAALLAAPALAAPGSRDVERAATRAAQALDGVLRDCPASFSKIGTSQKKCVGMGGTVEQARTRLGSALSADLYGVWRSRDEQRSVYNWVRTPGGYVYLRLQPDPDGRAQTLGYFDTPPGTAPTTPPAASPARSSAPARPAVIRPPVTRTPVTKPPATKAPASSTPAAKPPVTTPAVTAPSATARPAPQPPAATSLAPQPFSRPLQLQAQRVNGADVRAVQDRLIALTRPSGGGRGDGWYGPVTAATVRAFQAANDLPVTGRVDRATWDALFSTRAQTFAADSIR